MKKVSKTHSVATLHSGKVLLRTEPLKSIFILHRYLGYKHAYPLQNSEFHT